MERGKGGRIDGWVDGWMETYIITYHDIHQQVLRENRQLQAKLERLEGVFNVGDVQLVGDMAAPAAR